MVGGLGNLFFGVNPIGGGSGAKGPNRASWTHPQDPQKTNKKLTKTNNKNVTTH